jgi:hypothetical protein
LSRATYVSKAVATAAVGTLIFAAVVLYFVIQPPQQQEPRLIAVDCLNVENGPTLQFESGVLKASDRIVGTYEFRPAVPGKYGPSIHVEGIRVQEADGRVVVLPGNEGWFWPFQDENTVEIFYYPQNRAVAHRCTA